MSEIKPVYQLRYGTGDVEVTEEQYFRESYMRGTPRRMLYPAAAYEALQKENEFLYEENKTLKLCIENDELSYKIIAERNEAQAKRIAELEEDLQFVERWANHHGTKPNVTAQEALSCIQHYPSIAEITKSYKDGVIPSTRNPYAEIESLRKQVDEHKEWHMMRDEMRKALEAQKKWR